MIFKFKRNFLHYNSPLSKINLFKNNFHIKDNELIHTKKLI